VLGVQEVVLSVISMLNNPNIESPANVDASVAASDQIEFRDNLDVYRKRVRKMVRESQENC